MKNNIGGFLSSPFFAAIKTNDVNIPEKVPNRTDIDTDSIIKGFVLRNIHYTGFETVVIPKEELINAVKESILDTLVIEDLVSYFVVDEEESVKALNLIKRKQYNAKLVIAVLTNFLAWFDYIDEAKLALVLLINVRQKINSLKEKIVIDKCGEFKTLMDKVTGGISLDCYVSFVSKINKTYSLNEFITDYILTKHGYSFDKYLGNLFSYTNINEIILSLAIYNNPVFWNFDNNSFLIFFFLNLVLKYHGLAYVKKIVDFAFSQICQTKEGLFIYEHKLPLYFLSSSLENNILTLAINKIKRRLGQAINLNINLEEAQGLLYPVNSGFLQEIAKGKEVFINFIQKAYPNDASFVLKLFSDTNSIIQDETKENNILKKRKIALAEMLDYDILDYYDFNELKAYFTGLNANFSTNDATLSRFYYRVYLISKYAKDITNECIYEVYFDLLNMLSLKYNLLCHYQINNELREAKYKVLKEVLAAFALKINDRYKAIYIAALLDRKSATLNETMLYAELEQLGDAIYNLAVCNILFYNEETKLTNKTKEEYIKADAEVKVANYLCLNKLYISNLVAALNSKYLDYEEDIDRLSKKHYLADALEMLLAAISKEFGIAKAIAFATTIIINSFPNLAMPVIPKFDLSSLYSSNLSRRYLSKIFPTLSDLDDSEFADEYLVLLEELEKLVNIASINNETKEKRRYLTYFHAISYKKDSYDMLRYYLYNGIEDTIKEYKNSFIEYYNKVIKRKYYIPLND